MKGQNKQAQDILCEKYMELINFIDKERKKLVMQGHNNRSDLSYSTML